MTPDELRESLHPKQVDQVADGQFVCFLDLMTGGEPEQGDLVPPIVNDIDLWEDARVEMSDEAWKAYLDDTLMLAMGQCPRCLAPVTTAPINGSKVVSSFNCTRFHDHTFVRAVPLNPERS